MSKLQVLSLFGRYPWLLGRRFRVAASKQRSPVFKFDAVFGIRPMYCSKHYVCAHRYEGKCPPSPFLFVRVAEVRPVGNFTDDDALVECCK
jgi:hypothetical protein